MNLPSGFVILLKNCYYIPAISRNIILVSYLDLDGFTFIIKHNVILIYRKDIFYGNTLRSNDFCILELKNTGLFITLILSGLDQRIKLSILLALSFETSN